MTKAKLYRYLGRNGTLTTRIQIEGASFIPMLKLTADEGKILTDGENKVYSVDIYEEELENWKEIADNTNKSN